MIKTNLSSIELPDILGEVVKIDGFSVDFSARGNFFQENCRMIKLSIVNFDDIEHTSEINEFRSNIFGPLPVSQEELQTDNKRFVPMANKYLELKTPPVTEQEKESCLERVVQVLLASTSYLSVQNSNDEIRRVQRVSDLIENQVEYCEYLVNNTSAHTIQHVWMGVKIGILCSITNILESNLVEVIQKERGKENRYFSKRPKESIDKYFARVVSFLKLLVRGLQCLHKNGLTHNDLKRSCVLVGLRRDGSFIPQITNFGASDQGAEVMLLKTEFSGKFENSLAMRMNHDLVRLLIIFSKLLGIYHYCKFSPREIPYSITFVTKSEKSRLLFLWFEELTMSASKTHDLDCLDVIKAADERYREIIGGDSDARQPLFHREKRKLISLSEEESEDEEELENPKTGFKRKRDPEQGKDDDEPEEKIQKT